ncbi:hypothetical protein CLV92_1259 [Kineococcus xinjiangensis]|uniref:Uncharacterized protein n=1 Tax=Kineococcus xinjiangensis TaxID=512762 RepID=A0A2S6IC44_9ACTN|nr:hypothetical protein [Kineococcus xinjiangensis]PPK90213.1 hypothetical protein CLV92_1259 [Kineococcus xinjiangensis]
MAQDTLTTAEKLRLIERADPDGDESRTDVPSGEDYRAHQRWAVDRFGHDVWEQYIRGGWDTPRDFGYVPVDAGIGPQDY